jgi:uncharacterized protein YgfB (UPF0149 family)
MSTRKGKKPVKNVPLLHEELKGRHCVWLTPKSWDRLQKKATNDGISISELLEKIATEIEF